jgi:hypothetical protein
MIRSARLARQRRALDRRLFARGPVRAENPVHQKAKARLT